MKNKKKTLSLVIPMYNEENRLTLAIEQIKCGIKSESLLLSEVIFVNDGSVDTTLAKVRKYAVSLRKKLKIPVEIITYQDNRGKGFAVRTGMLKAHSDYSLLADVDMSTPLSEITKLDPYVQDGGKVIIGTRKNGESTVVVAQPRYRQIMGKAFTWLTQKFLDVQVTDFTCGFKLFSRDARIQIFSNSKIDRWGYDAEIMFLAQKYDFSIKEKALLWYNDERTNVSVLKAVTQTLTELLQIRLFDLRGVYSIPLEHVTLKERGLSWQKKS